MTGENAKQGSRRECGLGPPAALGNGQGPLHKENTQPMPTHPSQAQALTYASAKLCRCLKKSIEAVFVRQLAYAADGVITRGAYNYSHL